MMMDVMVPQAIADAIAVAYRYSRRCLHAGRRYQALDEDGELKLRREWNSGRETRNDCVL